MPSRIFLVFAAACAIATLAAVPSAAQLDAGAPSPQPDQSNERVVVTAPRTYHGSGVHGGEIHNVSMTGNVRFDDLDLSTPWGKNELRHRVRLMASSLCHQLDERYPAAIQTQGQPSCYQQALDSAMRRADEVMADSRYDYWKQ